MFIKLGKDFFDPDHIAVVRPSGKKATIIFTTGSSAFDGGFLINLPHQEVLERIDEAKLNEVALMLARAEGAEGAEETDLGEAEDLQERKIRREVEAQEESQEGESLAS